jgi:hypothetical protein
MAGVHDRAHDVGHLAEGLLLDELWRLVLALYVIDMRRLASAITQRAHS